MSVQEANAWLMGAGVPSCSFLNIGDTHEGTVTEIEMGQQRDLKTGQPKTWDDGRPMMQMILTLQTEERDPEIENDNGMRKLYIGSKGLREALAAAVKKSGAQGIGVGGKVGMRYVRNGEATQRGFNPPKEYAAKYEAPTVSVDDGYDEGPAHPNGTSRDEYAEYGEEPF